MTIRTALIKDRDFRKKVTGTAAVLLICRIFYNIPVYGTNSTAAALSIEPFISATILTQVLAVISPSLFRIMKRQTKNDEIKAERINFAAGLAIAAAESFILAYFLSKQGMLINDSMLQILMTAAIWTGCSALLARLGKLISDRFIGNGISLILLLNIVCSLPSELIRVFSEFVENKTDAESIVNIAVIAATVVALFMISYLLCTAEKRIPVRYSRKLSSDERARRFDYIPLKLCPGSVMPVICAGMIYMLISTVILAVCGPDSEYIKYFESSAWLDINSPVYSAGLAAYLMLIIAFTFVYNRISSNPAETAKRLEKAGCVIENIRPGMDTYMYLKHETKKMLLKGALIICAIATLPVALSNVFGISGLSFIGTTSVIICGIIIETYKKLFAWALAGAQKSRLDKGGLL